MMLEGVFVARSVAEPEQVWALGLSDPSVTSNGGGVVL